MQLVKPSNNNTQIYRINGEIRLRCKTDTFCVGGLSFDENVPYKGLTLNQLSGNWKQLVEEHLQIATDLVSKEPADLLNYGVPVDFIGNSTLVKTCIPIPISCLVRGYSDSRGHKLDKAIYLPFMKNRGNLDPFKSLQQEILYLSDFIKKKLNLSSDAEVELEAQELSECVENVSREVYEFMHEYTLKRGLILAETQLNFGFIRNSNSGEYELALINDVGIPDEETIFWDAETFNKKEYQVALHEVLSSRKYATQIICDEQLVSMQSYIYAMIFKHIFEKDVVEVSTGIMWDCYKILF